MSKPKKVEEIVVGAKSGSRKPEAPEGFVDIKEATVLLGFKHTQYTRRLLAQGDPEAGTGLWGEKRQYKGYSKWWISLEAIESYKAIHRREYQGRRFILNTALENEGKIRKALDALGIEFALKLAYVPKSE